MFRQLPVTQNVGERRSEVEGRDLDKDRENTNWATLKEISVTIEHGLPKEQRC